MNYFFDCPYCSQSFEVEAELAGLNCVCTGCGEVFVVPTPPRNTLPSGSPRLDDMEDLRPEIWTPEDTAGPAQDHGPEMHPPHSPQHAGETVIGDQLVPVTFVPTGMQPMSEVYGMMPEPESENAGVQNVPAEVKVRRVTPMMIENSGVHRPDAQTGIVRHPVTEDDDGPIRPAKQLGGGVKYAVLGVAAGLVIGAMGLRAVKTLFRGGPRMSEVQDEVGASDDKNRDVKSDGEGSDVGRMEPANRFPDGFMGIKFGTKIDYIPDRVTWAKEAENLHKPAMLADERVQAVLIPDHDGRLTVGAYVRISDSSDNELVPFLEWALTVQDAVTSKFGRPSSVHVVKNAATETDIVRKIRSGADFYECTWEDPFAQCMITLSVSGRSARLVVFRLEYKSIPLTRSYLNRKASD